MSIKYLPVGTIEVLKHATNKKILKITEVIKSQRVEVQPWNSLLSRGPQMSSSKYSTTQGTRITEINTKPINTKPR
jgi:hypothetical protein